MRLSPPGLVAFLMMIQLYLGLATAEMVFAGTLELTVKNEEGEVVPFRIHLKDAQGKAVPHPELPYHFDHFCVPGELNYDLTAGNYSFEIEKGPEYEQLSGEFSLPENGIKKLAFTIKRLINMNKRGWYSGDLHIHRPLEEAPLLLKTEELNIGPVISWWNERNVWKGKELPRETLQSLGENQWMDVMAGEDEREGGALLYFHRDAPLDIRSINREFPSSVQFLKRAAKHDQVHIDIEKPFWWDVPIWVMTDKIDTIGLANNHMCRASMYETEAWGFPRDTQNLPSPLGNGYWTQEIYYHLLNSGIRIPPSAGSASDVLPNPVGYNRVYVHVEGELTWDKWWEGLRAGRSFVTNGPHLEVTADGELPGHVFQVENEAIIKLAGTVTSRDEVDQIQWIRNGEVIRSDKAGSDPSQSLPEVEIKFEQSGWFLVRVLVKNDRTFRFASTAPFYVEVKNQPKYISKKSTLFFADWLGRRLERLKEHVKNNDQLQKILPDFEKARRFWIDRHQTAEFP
ncbi:MAG: CehA/McbA family metallohydrolase [Planctomycetaceae bacterium]